MRNLLRVGIVVENKLGQQAEVVSVIKRNNKENQVVLKFLNTKATKKFGASNVRKKAFKDDMEPFVYGVGFLGNKTKKNNYYEYKTWNHMLERCYSKNVASYKNYGGRGVTVCDRWHNFSLFMEDVVKLDGYEEYSKNNIKGNRNPYSLDKDRKGNGLSYSFENCMFLTSKEQRREQDRITPVMSISDKGEKKKFDCITDACSELGVQNANLYKVLNGERKHTLGYTFVRL